MGSQGSTPETPHELVLRDGQRISGSIREEKIVVPPGVTVCVDDDVRLQASYELLVQGTLQCSDRASEDRKAHGPLIELVSDRSIVVLGVIRGGKGQCYDELAPPKYLGRAGGPGSSILLRAPSITVAGTITAGNGGNAGRGGQGGPGGWVCRIGSPGTTEALAADPPARAVLAGGTPGRGGVGDWNYKKGRVGTDGTWGSSLQFSNDDDYRAAFDAGRVTAAFPAVIGH
jgi:hypothetical protein